MKNEEIQPYYIEGTTEYDANLLPDLINNHVSCELPEEPELKKTIKDLQIFPIEYDLVTLF